MNAQNTIIEEIVTRPTVAKVAALINRRGTPGAAHDLGISSFRLDRIVEKYDIRGAMERSVTKSFSSPNTGEKRVTTEPEALHSEESDDEGFFVPEKRGIRKGVLGGIIMMAIATIWFVLGYAAGRIFFYSPILFVIGLYAFIKGLATGNISGE